jgi:hypothetical protein
MRLGTIVLGALLAMAATACGAPDNVGACKQWLSNISCGSYDFSQFMSCESYRDLSCDITEYFDCLTANTKCNDGVPDNSGWTGCASKAQCK